MTAPGKITFILLAFVAASELAAAQHAAARPLKRPPAAAPHGPAAHAYVRPPRPVVIPQQTAPPQEEFASFPGKDIAPVAAPSPCDQRLAQVAVFRSLARLIAPGECGATDAVLLDTVTLADRSKVTIAPPATMRCEMAQAVAQWLRDDVAPAAQKLGSPVRRLDNLGSYECRGRDRVRGATLSEHGRANALDVHDFRLANGKTIVLVDPKAPKEFRDVVRDSACARFSTVLGPGSDAEHAEHVHLDLEERRNNYKICEWDVREPVVLAKGSAPPVTPEEVPLPLPRPPEADDGRKSKRR